MININELLLILCGNEDAGVEYTGLGKGRQHEPLFAEFHNVIWLALAA